MDSTTFNPIDDYILARIKYRVDHLIGNFGFTCSDHEDLAHDLVVAVLEAAPKFDPSKSTWRGFARRVLNRRCIDLIRSACTERANHERRTVCCDDATIKLPDADPTPQMDLAIDCQQLCSQLTGRTRRVCMLLMHMNPPQIAEQLRVSETTVRREVRKVREHFRAAGLDGAC